MIPLDEKVVRLASALARADVPFAFGGAIALAYYATPRGTHDVDINVFLPAEAFDRVLAILEGLGVSPPSTSERAGFARDEQIRLYWDRTPLDLFFSYNALHDACLQRLRHVAFGEVRIPILSAEDLAIFKVLFAREKDWRDLDEMLLTKTGAFETRYALDWLERIVTPDDERSIRFRALLEERRAL